MASPQSPLPPHQVTLVGAPGIEPIESTSSSPAPSTAHRRPRPVGTDYPGLRRNVQKLRIDDFFLLIDLHVLEHRQSLDQVVAFSSGRRRPRSISSPSVFPRPHRASHRLQGEHPVRKDITSPSLVLLRARSPAA